MPICMVLHDENLYGRKEAVKVQLCGQWIKPGQ
jgi:hypothetical protein